MERPKKPRPNRQKKDKDKPRDPTKDYRFLEVCKLSRSHQPVTVNGIPRAKITKDDSEPKALREYFLQLVTSLLDIYVSISLVPSDPDFPYDLDLLNFSLCVPQGYPHDKSKRPSIVVLNDDIPRGFAVNVEQGFKKIAGIAVANEKFVLEKRNGDEVEEVPITLIDGKGLLSQVKTLDKYLEEFLKQEKRLTIKFVSFKQTPTPTPPPESKPEKKTEKKKNDQRKNGTSVSIPPDVVARRDEYVDELVGRFKSIKLFNKNTAGSKYRLSIPTTKGPEVWTRHGSFDLFLHVPSDYPDTPATVSIPNNFTSNLIVKYKEQLEELPALLMRAVNETRKFEKTLVAAANAKQWKHPSLVYLVNYIANHYHELAV